MRQQLRHLVLSLILSIATITHSYAATTLQIGIAPHSSARVIIESHASLRSYLEDYFRQPVQILTAPTFSEFAKRCNQGAYDLVITSPHLALLAQQQAHYQPLYTYTQGLETVIITANTQRFERTPLRVVGLDPVSFVTLTGLRELQTNQHRSLDIQYASASDSAAEIVLQDKADAAIMSLPNYNKLSDTVRAQLNVVWRSQPLPSRIYLVKANNGYTVADWQGALSGFIMSPQGQAHVIDQKLKAFRPVTANELDGLQDLAQSAQAILNQSAP